MVRLNSVENLLAVYPDDNLARYVARLNHGVHHHHGSDGLGMDLAKSRGNTMDKYPSDELRINRHKQAFNSQSKGNNVPTLTNTNSEVSFQCAKKEMTLALQTRRLYLQTCQLAIVGHSVQGNTGYNLIDFLNSNMRDWKLIGKCVRLVVSHSNETRWVAHLFNVKVDTGIMDEVALKGNAYSRFCTSSMIYPNFGSTLSIDSLYHKLDKIQYTYSTMYNSQKSPMESVALTRVFSYKDWNYISRSGTFHIPSMFWYMVANVHHAANNLLAEAGTTGNTYHLKDGSDMLVVHPILLDGTENECDNSLVFIILRDDRSRNIVILVDLSILFMLLVTITMDRKYHVLVGSDHSRGSMLEMFKSLANSNLFYMDRVGDLNISCIINSIELFCVILKTFQLLLACIWNSNLKNTSGLHNI